MGQMDGTLTENESDAVQVSYLQAWSEATMDGGGLSSVGAANSAIAINAHAEETDAEATDGSFVRCWLLFFSSPSSSVCSRRANQKGQ